MKPAAVVAGYFVVALAFFALGRLTAERGIMRDPPVPVPRTGPAEPGPLRLESVEVKPHAGATAMRHIEPRPTYQAPSAGDPVIPPDTQPSDDPSPSEGPSDAHVIVLEVSDFQCPVCKRAHEPLKRLVSDFPGRVRRVFKQNPLKMHRNALNAAAASMAAARQGRFWEYADRLFQNQAALSEDDLFRYASEVGLAMERFRKDFRDPSLRARALAEGEAAMNLGARGTPAFFVNGRMQVGWASYESLRQMVQQEIAAVDALVAAGRSVKEARVERIRATLQGADDFLRSVLGREFHTP